MMDGPRLFQPDLDEGAGVPVLRPRATHLPDDPTVQWVVDLYLHESGNTASRAQGDRGRVLARFCADYGLFRISACKPAHLELWLNARTEWPSPWTQQRACATIQRPFNWASKLGIIQRNPFQGVSRRPGEPGRSMEELEYRRLLRRSDALFRRVLLFLRYTGCRPGEMAGLEWEHIDAESGVIVLQRHKTRKMQRQPRPRVIVLHPLVVRLLIWLRRHAAKGQRFVFVNRRGNPWTRSSMALRMGKLRRKCALAKDCKIYGLRHGFATRAVENGVELKTLAELLGHTTVRMAEHYTHLGGRTKHLHEAVLRAMGKVDGER